MFISEVQQIVEETYNRHNVSEDILSYVKSGRFGIDAFQDWYEACPVPYTWDCRTQCNWLEQIGSRYMNQFDKTKLL